MFVPGFYQAIHSFSPSFTLPFPCSALTRLVIQNQSVSTTSINNSTILTHNPFTTPDPVFKFNPHLNALTDNNTHIQIPPIFNIIPNNTSYHSLIINHYPNNHHNNLTIQESNHLRPITKSSNLHNHQIINPDTSPLQ